MVRVLVLFYSMYGHNYTMAKAVADGAKEVDGAEVHLQRVKETLPDEVLEKMHAKQAQEALSQVPIADPHDLDKYDVVIFGCPTRFGNMPAQMKTYFDACGQHWMKDSLVGKLAACFTSSNTQHGGQESTLLSMHTVLLHLGFVVSGLPYSFKGQSGVDEVKGCSPYGASMVAGADGSRQPSQAELSGAKYLGKHTTTLGKKLCTK